MESEAIAIALSACALFGYGFFLGYWAGSREARLRNKAAADLCRRSRDLLRRNGYAIDQVDVERKR